MQKKSSFRIGMAIVASILIAGAGHLILGFWRRAIYWLLGVIAVAFITSYFLPQLTQGRVPLLGIALGIAAAIDAWRKAEQFNVAIAEKEEAI